MPHFTQSGFQKVTINSSHAGGIGLVVKKHTTVNAGSFVNGAVYEIKTVGSTDFTAIGAGSNAVGVVFTASGAGSGTGVAIRPYYYTRTGDNAGNWTSTSLVTNSLTCVVGGNDFGVVVPAPTTELTTFEVWNTVLSAASPAVNLALSSTSPTPTSPLTFTSQSNVSCDIRSGVITDMALNTNSATSQGVISGKPNSSLGTNNGTIRTPVYWKYDAASGKKFVISRQPEVTDFTGIPGSYSIVSASVRSITLTTEQASGITAGMKITSNDHSFIPADTVVSSVSGAVITTNNALTSAFAAGDNINFDNGWGVTGTLVASLGKDTLGREDNTVLTVSGTLSFNSIGSADLNITLAPGEFVSMATA